MKKFGKIFLRNFLHFNIRDLILPYEGTWVFYIVVLGIELVKCWVSKLQNKIFTSTSLFLII